MNIVVKAAHTISVPQQTVEIPDNPTFTFTDDPVLKRVTVTVKTSSQNAGLKEFNFVLWSGADYTNIGDYTQQQINASVSAYLTAIKATS
jgi:hypothetical protein